MINSRQFQEWTKDELESYFIDIHCWHFITNIDEEPTNQIFVDLFWCKQAQQKPGKWKTKVLILAYSLPFNTESVFARLFTVLQKETRKSKCILSNLHRLTLQR